MTTRAVSIVVPARNEELRLPRLLETLSNGGRQVIGNAGLAVDEIVVVDDASTDGTAALVERHAQADARLRLVRPDRGGGKGAAVRAGMLAATAPWALLMDADLATPLDEIGPLADALRAGADIAIGSRGLSASDIVVRQPAHRELAGRAFNLMMRAATGLPFRDTQCGFKLFRLSTTRVLFEAQRTDGFAFDVEILLEARRQGLDVVELPVRWIDDPQTQVRMASATAEMTADLLRITLRHRRLVRRAARIEGVWKITKQGGRAK